MATFTQTSYELILWLMQSLGVRLL